MPRSVLEYRCLLISPSDVKEERDALAEVVNHWNAQIGDSLGARIELMRWESHTIPDISGPPQGKINEQLLHDCDFAIAVFWYRLGTPTNEYESGSIEEIYKLRESGKRVLVYFSSKAIPQDALKDDQFLKLQEVKNKLQKEGLLGSYSDLANLKEQVQLHITKVISDLLSRDRTDISQFIQQAPTTLPKPDIRVKVKGGIVMSPLNTRSDIITIEVQNHSPMTVFIGNIRIKLKDDRSLFVAADAITKEFQKRRELKPGEAFSFNIASETIVEKVDVEDLVCVTVSDDIERTYESNRTDLQKLLRSILKK